MTPREAAAELRQLAAAVTAAGPVDLARADDVLRRVATVVIAEGGGGLPLGMRPFVLAFLAGTLDEVVMRGRIMEPARTALNLAHLAGLLDEAAS